MEYNLVIKKNEIMPFSANWMDLEITILSKVSQRQTSYETTYMWNLKRWYTWTYLQNRNRVTNVENKLMVTKEGSEERDKLGNYDWQVLTLLHVNIK